MEVKFMRGKVKKNKNSLLRKSIIVFFLPSLIIIWMIGWVLVHTSSPSQIIQENQKVETSSENLSIEQEREQEAPILV
jgi:hypothetical protein